MIPLLRTLKVLMEIQEFSPGDVAKYIGCSQGTAYNWLVYKRTSPSLMWQEQIRNGIKKIKKNNEINIEVEQGDTACTDCKYFQRYAPGAKYGWCHHEQVQARLMVDGEYAWNIECHDDFGCKYAEKKVKTK